MKITPCLKSVLFVIIIVSACAGRSSLASTHKPSPPLPSHEVIDIQLGVQDLLLKMKGVKYVATASCEEDSGKLVAGLRFKTPLMDCIAVRFNTAQELKAAKSVFKKLREIKGALIHFTLKDPIPNKGGITVHN